MITRQFVAFWGTALLWLTPLLAGASEKEDTGHVIATPREAELMDKGYLFFPSRVVPKFGAAQALESKTQVIKPLQAKAMPAHQTIAASPPAPVVTEPDPVPEVAQATQPDAVPVVVAAPPPEPVAPPSKPTVAADKIMQSSAPNRMSTPHQQDQSSVYVGVGTGLTVGLNMPGLEGRVYRLEYVDGGKSPQANKSYGGNAYQTSRTEQTLGLFLDWSPNNDNWYLTGGLTLNNHQIQVHALPNSSVVINEKSTTVGSGYLNFDYKMPDVTPYVGVRYVQKPEGDWGWAGFGEFGLLLGKLNATSTASLADASITNADITAQSSIIRKSIYRWSVVPKAVVGLSYKY